MVFWGQIRVDETKLLPTITWPNFIFSQLFVWFGADNGQTCLPIGWTSEFWPMFEPTDITLPHFIFGPLFKHNYQIAGEQNYQIWLLMDQMSDSEQCSNHLQPDIISLLVNFSCALGQIMTRYDFLWARRVILSNVQINFKMTKFNFSLTHHVQGWDSGLK